MLKRFARTIEIEVSPEQFVYRCGPQERRVATWGYIKVREGRVVPNTFAEQQRTSEHMPINLLALPPELREDVVEILEQFISYGVRPFCRLLRPVIVFKGLERFATGFGFEYAAFREAGKLVALGDEKVCFRR